MKIMVEVIKRDLLKLVLNNKMNYTKSKLFFYSKNLNKCNIIFKKTYDYSYKKIIKSHNNTNWFKKQVNKDINYCNKNNLNLKNDKIQKLDKINLLKSILFKNDIKELENYDIKTDDYTLLESLLDNNYKKINVMNDKLKVLENFQIKNDYDIIKLKYFIKNKIKLTINVSYNLLEKFD